MSKISKKRLMKQVRQYTTGNRVPKYKYNEAFKITSDEIQKGFLLSDFRKAIQKAKISIQYIPYLLGEYEQDTSEIIINPCVVLDAPRVADTPLAQVVIHQLMRWTWDEENLEIGDCVRDYRDGYYSIVEEIIPEHIATVGLEYMCEKYLCEYGTKYLMEGLYVDRIPNADDYMLWLDKSICKIYTDNMIDESIAKDAILQLQELAVIYANQLADYCGVLEYVQVYYEDNTKKLQVS